MSILNAQWLVCLAPSTSYSLSECRLDLSPIYPGNCPVVHSTPYEVILPVTNKLNLMRKFPLKMRGADEDKRADRREMINILLK